jgi:hypothetical protein
MMIWHMQAVVSQAQLPWGGGGEGGLDVRYRERRATVGLCAPAR